MPETAVREPETEEDARPNETTHEPYHELDELPPPDGKWRTWAGLPHLRAAERIQRREFGGAFEIFVPPAGKRAEGISKDDLLTVEKYEELRSDFAARDFAEQDRERRTIWRQYVANQLTLEAMQRRGVDTSLDHKSYSGQELQTIEQLGNYYSWAMETLVSQSLLDPNKPGRHEVFLRDLEHFQELVHRREEYESRLKGYKTRQLGRMVLGAASATRFAYRTFSGLPSLVISEAYSRAHNYRVSSREIRDGRRLKLAATAYIVISAGAIAAKVYRAYKQAGLPTMNLPWIPDIAPSTTTKPSPAPAETGGPSGNNSHGFGEAAYTIDQGEGWLHEISEVFPTATDEQVRAIYDSVSGQLTSMTGHDGAPVAYEAAGEVGLNQGDGRMSQAPLELILSAGQKLGLKS